MGDLSEYYLGGSIEPPKPPLATGQHAYTNPKLTCMRIGGGGGGGPLSA